MTSNVGIDSWFKTLRNEKILALGSFRWRVSSWFKNWRQKHGVNSTRVNSYTVVLVGMYFRWCHELDVRDANRRDSSIKLMYVTVADHKRCIHSPLHLQILSNILFSYEGVETIVRRKVSKPHSILSCFWKLCRSSSFNYTTRLNSENRKRTIEAWFGNLLQFRYSVREVHFCGNYSYSRLLSIFSFV